MTKTAVDNLKKVTSTTIHKGSLRLLHWLNAMAVLVLISSGWAIYNADPFYDFSFTNPVLLGNFLTEALRWHLALAWFFFATVLLFIIFRVLMSVDGPALKPVSLKGVYADMIAAIAIRLHHSVGTYNQIQRIFYLSIMLLFFIVLLSGLALWKPVQLYALTELFGCYESTRRVHFWTMVSIVIFIVVHLFMIIITPSTLLSMIFGAETKNRKEVVRSENDIIQRAKKRR